jgi:membrane dipeptidase
MPLSRSKRDSKGYAVKTRNRHSRYRPYDYLEKGDLWKFEMTEAVEWEGMNPYKIPLSKAQEKRVARIIEENVVISLHDHLISLPRDRDQMIRAIKESRPYTFYEALRESCLDAVFDGQSMYVFLGAHGGGWKWDDCIYDLGMRLCDIEHQDFVIQGKEIEDILRAHKDGKVALIPSFESCTMIENELDRLDVLYGLGVRMLGITYSEANLLGSGLNEKRDGGLTLFGRKAVERLNKLGIAIDIAHSGDQTCLDVIEASAKPVFISHAGARTVWNTKRMVPDEVILASARKGGVIGIEAAPNTTRSEAHLKHTIDSCFDHLQYCVDLVGAEHVAFGPDTMYGDHCGLHVALSKVFPTGDSIREGHKDVPKISYVKGLENPTESSKNIVRYLVKSGYPDEDIAKIIGGNVLRALKEVWVK